MRIGPFVLLAALIVKLTSPGPAFYTQTRAGRFGKPFTIYKIRTMVDNCESLTGPRWSMPGDPRVTAFVRFLRVSHLDEMPQLLNVLCGDMSLIGPRPERPEFIPELERELPGYRGRLAQRNSTGGHVNSVHPNRLRRMQAQMEFDWRPDRSCHGKSGCQRDFLR